MIKQEIKSVRGQDYEYTYSDGGFMIIQDGTGIVYGEAYDPVGSGRTYTESDEVKEYGLD